MTLTETCCCGATFSVTWRFGQIDVGTTLYDFRQDHKRCLEAAVRRIAQQARNSLDARNTE